MSYYLRVFLMGGLLLSACAPQSQGATIVVVAKVGTNPYLDCTYDGFQQGRAFGIISIEKGHVPTQGASITGNLNGFGKRTIHNESSNEDVGVNVVYHVDTYEGVLSRLQDMGCSF